MAKGRRGNNEGSITKRKDGRWQGAITMSLPDGESKRVFFYGKTRSEVTDKMKQKMVDQSMGQLALPNKITVEQLVTKWLNTTIKIKVKEATHIIYDRMARCYIFPYIGDILIKDLTTEKAQNFYNKLLVDGGVRGKGVSSTTVLNTHKVLNGAFDDAERQQLINRNPLRFVSLPGKNRPEFKILSPEQLNVFLETAKSHWLFPAFLMEWGTGLRRGELLGLKWEDVDFDHNCITVRRSVGWIRGKGIVIDDTKTSNSNRRIDVPLVVMDILKSHKAQQGAEKLRLGADYPDNNLVFRNKFGRTLDPNHFSKYFSELLKKANLPHIRFHDMRHSHASMLLLLGEHPKVVQERLGHSRINITLDLYSHVMPGLQEKAAEKIGSTLTIDLKQKREV